MLSASSEEEEEEEEEAMPARKARSVAALSVIPRTSRSSTLPSSRYVPSTAPRPPPQTSVPPPP
eukprot:2970870-Rhodomonas_salina.1